MQKKKQRQRKAMFVIVSNIIKLLNDLNFSRIQLQVSWEYVYLEDKPDHTTKSNQLLTERRRCIAP